MAQTLCRTVLGRSSLVNLHSRRTRAADADLPIGYAAWYGILLFLEEAMTQLLA
jgi:hypothetical protein